MRWNPGQRRKKISIVAVILNFEKKNYNFSCTLFYYGMKIFVLSLKFYEFIFKLIVWNNYEYFESKLTNEEIYLAHLSLLV